MNPDEHSVHKPTLRQGFRSIVRSERGEKATKMIYASGGRSTVVERRVPRADRERLALTADEVLQLARWCVTIEEHYSEQADSDRPMDIEWAKDGRTGELFIVQARPEAVHSRRVTRER